MKMDEALACRLVETYSNQLLRVAYSLLNSVPDAQDVCQEVMLKRLRYPGEFESMTHERAWLVRVTVNACKNLRRSPWHRRTVGLDTVAEHPAFQPEEGGVLEEVQRLPVQYREVLVLYYYMGYDTNEIGTLLLDFRRCQQGDGWQSSVSGVFCRRGVYAKDGCVRGIFLWGSVFGRR